MVSLAAVGNDLGNSGGLWLTPDKPTLEAGYRVSQGLWVGSAFSLKPHIWREGSGCWEPEPSFLATGGRSGECGKDRKKGFLLAVSFEKRQRQLPFCPTVGRVGWRVNSSQSQQRLCTPSFQRKGFSSASYLLLFLLFSLPVSPASLLQSTTLAFSELCGTIHLPFRYEGYPAGTSVTPLIQRARQVSSSFRLHRFSFKT